MTTSLEYFGSPLPVSDGAGDQDKLREIKLLCIALAEKERMKYGQGSEYDRSDDTSPASFSSQQARDALMRNEDGDAWLYVELHRGHFCYDTAAGCWYGWNGHFWTEDLLGDALRNVDGVINVYRHELDRLHMQNQREFANESEKVH